MVRQQALLPGERGLTYRHGLNPAGPATAQGTPWSACAWAAWGGAGWGGTNTRLSVAWPPLPAPGLPTICPQREGDRRGAHRGSKVEGPGPGPQGANGGVLGRPGAPCLHLPAHVSGGTEHWASPEAEPGGDMGRGCVPGIRMPREREGGACFHTCRFSESQAGRGRQIRSDCH